ncbi:Calmodulin-binding protein 60 B [Linum perenne]
MTSKRRSHNDTVWDDDHTQHGGQHASSPSAEDHPSPKRFRSAVRDILGKQSMSDFASGMEPFLRSVIRDEVEKAVLRVLSRQPSLGSSRGSFDGSRPKSGLILHFVNKLSATIFTNSRIEAEDGNPLRIVLLDAATNTIVTSGPLSSMKVEIIVLDGDFGSDDREDWGLREFNTNVIKEREGRRPLVTGELSIVLKDGVGQITDVVFTDNSSWQRSRRFRLGAKAVVKSTAANGGEIVRIREARSESFIVKDHRGELYKKHYPPKLGDEVWRLERIAKEGAFHKRLSSNGIKTVKEFLQAYRVDQAALRNILGGGISNRIWESIVEHANTCVLDETKFYVYNDNIQGIKLLFNSVYKLVAAMFNGSQSYEPLDRLTPPQKVLLENPKRQAYKNIKELIPMDSRSVFSPRPPLPPPPPPPIQSELPFHLPTTTNNLDFHQLDFDNSTSSSSYVYDNSAESSLSIGSQLQYNNNTSPNQYFTQIHPSLKSGTFKFGAGSHDCGGHFPGWPPSSDDDENNNNNNGLMTPYQAPPSPAMFFTTGDVDVRAMLSTFPSFGMNRSSNDEMQMQGPVSPRGQWRKFRAAWNFRSMLVARRTWPGRINW